MTLNTILKKFLLISLLAFLIIGLTGCKKEFDPEDLVKFKAKPANFWDGLEHGVKLLQLPKSCHSTWGYEWGKFIGMLWCSVFIFFTWGLLLEGFFSGNPDSPAGCPVGCFSIFVGYWLGIGFYWIIGWLVQNVGIFFKWLASYVFS